MSLFSIVQGRTPPPAPPVPAQPAAGPMPVAPVPVSPANAYAPIGANIPSPPAPAASIPSPAPVGMGPSMAPTASAPQMVPAPPQFPPPGGMNIPGRAEGGMIPGYAGVPVGQVTEPGNIPAGQDPYMGVDPGMVAHYMNAMATNPLTGKPWTGVTEAASIIAASPDLRTMLGKEMGIAASAITGGEAASVALGHEQLAQKALTDQQARDDLWSKMIQENAVTQDTANQNYETKQDQLQQTNRSDAGTLGLKAFDSALAAARMVGGSYGPQGQWTANTPSLNFDASKAAGTNLPLPVLSKPNIPAMTRPY